MIEIISSDIEQSVGNKRIGEKKSDVAYNELSRNSSTSKVLAVKE